jgi:hypothetical protein
MFFPENLYGPLIIILLIAVIWRFQRQRSLQRRINDRINQLDNRWTIQQASLQKRLRRFLKINKETKQGRIGV